MTASDPSEILLWSDEFDYDGAPDASKWDYDRGGHGWGNHELQHYTDRLENACVRDGTLRIRAVREDFGGSRFTSARLVTRGRADWRCGRVEARVRLPLARGSWAAVWMLPTLARFGEWPRSGEIDLMEHVGMEAGRVHGTVHTARHNHLIGTQVGRAVALEEPAEGWHTYSVDWRPTGITFAVDGAAYHHYPRREGRVASGEATAVTAADFSTADEWERWPFDEAFHLVLNVAVGGSWGGQQGVDEAAFDGEGQVMEVDWVRVYRGSQGEAPAGGDAPTGSPE